nr:hypothetical protein [Tanacetum cinerariifolium]
VARFLDRVNRALGTGLIGKGLGMFYSRRRRRGRGSGRSRDGSERIQRVAMVDVTGVVKNQKRFGNLVQWWDLRRNGGARPVSQSP